MFFIQFGHNDEKSQDTNPIYRSILQLIQKIWNDFIRETRDKGATPIFIYSNCSPEIWKMDF